MGRREQGLQLYTGVLSLIAVVIVVQLWLSTVAMEALLGRHTQVLLPAAIASVVLALVNVALVRFVFRTDARIRRDAGPPE